MDSKNMIYVYTEYNDADAYGEQIIKLFSNRDDAREHLAKRVEICEGVPMEELRKTVAKDDRVDPDYVSVQSCNGTNFYIVRKLAVVPKLHYRAEITIPESVAEAIDRFLNNEPADASECLGEDETIDYEAAFENGMRMAIQCCGVQFRPPEEGESNKAWTQAVLFAPNGREVGYTEPAEEYTGEWNIGYKEQTYTVNVMVESSKRKPAYTVPETPEKSVSPEDDFIGEPAKAIDTKEDDDDDVL